MPHPNTRIGSLRDDLRRNALNVLELCNSSPVTVWVDELSTIHAASLEQSDSIPHKWIVGTYLLGVEIWDIEDDLRALRRERNRSWIVD